MGRKTKSDPNGQSGNVSKANTALRKRLRRARARVLKEFNAIPNIVVNQRERYYSYTYEAELLWLTILSIMNGELATQYDSIPLDWWFKSYIEIPWRQGTLDETRDIDSQVDRVISVQPILFSPQYLRGLRDAQAVNYGLIKTLSQDTAKQVFQVINDGMKGAKTPTEIKEEVKKRFNVSESNAKRIARTEVNKAYTDARLNTVMQLRDESGIDLGVVHISALLPTTRRHHADRHRKVYTVEQQRKWWNSGANRINCFTPDTVVQGRFEGGLKSFYSGKVIKFVTRDGRDLTVTPNHKIMTNRGLVKAAEIHEGDNFVTYDRNINKAIGVSDLNVHQVNTTIEQVFASLSEVGTPSMVGVMSVDFDGDERFLDENVDRILVDSPLIVGRDTKLFQLLDYFKFVHSDSAFIGGSTFDKFLMGLFDSFSRVSRIFGEKTLGFIRHVGMPKCLRLLMIPGGESRFFKKAVNDGSGYTDRLGNGVDGLSVDMSVNDGFNVDVNNVTLEDDTVLFEDTFDRTFADTKRGGYGIDGLPLGVSSDEVIRVIESDFSGHVYDLQESSGLMLANGIIASNCYCSVRTVVFNEDGQIADPVKRRDFKDMRDA